MIFLLDTNAFSDLMRENPRMDEHLSSLAADDSVVICTIVRGEILYGIARLPAGKRRLELAEKAANLFAVVPAAAVPENAAEHYASIKVTRQRKGLALDENDLWIAATALAWGATLISRDSDFRGIDGLTVDDWTT